tara:strand:+ start:91 stop:495 length:405 start_codon:yes stop_codon:yes gene_type:complete
MRITGWISTMAAVCALAACNAPDTATPDAEPTDAQSSAAEPATPSEAEPTPPTDEYANSRPALDNSTAEPTEGSCLAELGREKAETLSEQCYNMSPATRPACNIQNSCETIRAELKRGCEFGDTSDNPDYCDGV